MADGLKGTAERMRHDALARPGTPVKRNFEHGAVVALLFDGSEFKLRIARQGLAPKNDFSAQGSKRERAWERECETFRRAFDVPDASVRRDDAQGNFYFRIYAFAVGVSPMGTREVEHDTAAL